MIRSGADIWKTFIDSVICKEHNSSIFFSRIFERWKAKPIWKLWHILEHILRSQIFHNHFNLSAVSFRSYYTYTSIDITNNFYVEFVVFYGCQTCFHLLHCNRPENYLFIKWSNRYKMKQNVCITMCAWWLVLINMKRRREKIVKSHNSNKLWYSRRYAEPTHI